MAVTGVYVTISKIPGEGPWEQPRIFSNLSATPANFALTGGHYTIDCVGTTFGTVTLQRLSLDGSTWLTAVTAFAANGTATAYLPAALYKLAIG